MDLAYGLRSDSGSFNFGVSLLIWCQSTYPERKAEKCSDTIKKKHIFNLILLTIVIMERWRNHQGFTGSGFESGTEVNMMVVLKCPQQSNSRPVHRSLVRRRKPDTKSPAERLGFFVRGPFDPSTKLRMVSLSNHKIRAGGDAHRRTVVCSGQAVTGSKNWRGREGEGEGEGEGEKGRYPPVPGRELAVAWCQSI
jgi:hypothetical protein